MLPSALGGTSPTASIASTASACATPLRVRVRDATSRGKAPRWGPPRSSPPSTQSPKVFASEQQHVAGRIPDEGFEAAVKTVISKGKTALVIWFHFLGGSGSDWEQSLKTKIAEQLPWVEWHFPDAPQRPITNYDGQVARGWFDMLEGQVTECMETPGLDESVAATHSLLRQAEAFGLPASRIMLGGMSQGGVLALKAGLTYKRPLAGIAAFSAWVPPGLAVGIRHPSTPLLIGIGDRDDVVPLEICRRGVDLLERAGCSSISKKQYPGLDHTWASYETEDVKKFVAVVLPNQQTGNSKPACATRMCDFANAL